MITDPDRLEALVMAGPALWGSVSREELILAHLDPNEGTESFNLPGDLRATRRALQRLRRKGLAEAARCPDGAWVWFRTGVD